MKLHVMSASLWLFRIGLWGIIIYRHYKGFPKQYLILYLSQIGFNPKNITQGNINILSLQIFSS